MKKLLIALITFVALIIIIKLFFFSTYIVATDSMAPELRSGDRLLISKNAYSSSEPKRFDIIVFPYEDKAIIKRVIGLPGEQIEMKNNHLIINGTQVEEPFYSDASSGDQTKTEDFTLEEATGEEIVPEGTVFVLGDDRGDSMDSRDQSIGFIPIDDIEGKVIFRYLPFQQMKSW